MKLLSIIFSFYLIGLTIVPCEDESNLDTVSFEQITDLEDQHQTGADLCSPFCQCHCCHIHVLNIETVESEALDIQVSTLIIERNAESGIEIPDTHFQPPRI